MPLEAVGLLNVTYGNFTVENGQAYAADQVNTRPSCECSTALSTRFHSIPILRSQYNKPVL